MCVRCGASSPLTTQHRAPRGMGGTRRPWVNLPGNLITLCGSGTTGCHGWVESHRAEALSYGWLVSGLAVTMPSDVPVWTFTRGWVLLDDDGGFTPTMFADPKEAPC